jgi:hypothetical protein
MSKKQRKSKSKARVVTSRKVRSASIINHIFETVWAIGASVTAAIVISTSTHQGAPKGALFCVMGTLG